jgi:ribosomal protein S21
MKGIILTEKENLEIFNDEEKALKEGKKIVEEKGVKIKMYKIELYATIEGKTIIYYNN